MIEGLAALPGVPDRVQLVESKRIFRNGGLRLFLLENEVIVILGVKARINPLEQSFIFFSRIVHEVQVVTGLLEVGPVLLSDFLASLVQRGPEPFHLRLLLVELSLKSNMLAFSVFVSLNCH